MEIRKCPFCVLPGVGIHVMGLLLIFRYYVRVIPGVGVHAIDLVLIFCYGFIFSELYRSKLSKNNR